MTATKTRKLTRAEACVELARVIGWFECADWSDGPPDYFASRDAAAELVAWLSIHTLWDNFVERLNAIICGYDQVKFPGVAHNRGEVAKLFKRALLATPEQITLAACKALGIKVE